MPDLTKPLEFFFTLVNDFFSAVWERPLFGVILLLPFSFYVISLIAQLVSRFSLPSRSRNANEKVTVISKNRSHILGAILNKKEKRFSRQGLSVFSSSRSALVSIDGKKYFRKKSPDKKTASIRLLPSLKKRNKKKKQKSS